MADLSKLKLAIGQTEIVEGRPSANEEATRKMIERALDAGADALVVPSSFSAEDGVRLIGLNDSRIDVAGSVVVLDACGETYRIAVGKPVDGCDFSILADCEPYFLDAQAACALPRMAVVARPVGMRDCGKRLYAFDGGSYATDASGKVLARLDDAFEEDFAVLSLGAEGHLAAPCEKKTLKALIATLRCFDDQVLSWKPKWVIGLSGGLDSCVSAALLVKAFGADRVVASTMATRYNSQTTRNNASSCAQALGITLRNGAIEDMVVSLGNALVQFGYPADALKGVTLENAQARMRGNLLSTFAAVEGGVVVNNGNRVEGALGYATLYGDSIGAVCPIGDLLKTDLFDLARDLNDEFGQEVVPENLLPQVTDDGLSWDTMPSAELSPGQTDPMKWFYHDWLVAQLQNRCDGSSRWLYDSACDIMQEYLDDKLASTPVGRWVGYYGLDDPAAFAEDIKWVVSGIVRSSFKRIQSPPVIALASVSARLAACERQVAPEPPSRYRQLLSQLEG